MRFRVGVTDNDWFDFLSKRLPDEVNFWQPGGRVEFRALEPGEPFLFKLHSPLNYIAGGGYFVRHSRIPTSLAWEAFGENNGVDSYDKFLQKIKSYRGDNRQEHDPFIGCILLANPFFFGRDDWIPSPEDWNPNIVQGKNYDTNKSVGARLWKNIEERLSHVGFAGPAFAGEETAGYGEDCLVRARLGQGTFRILVTDAYGRRCAVTGERTLPVLEAAHIKPFAETGPNKVANGLLLRSDLHKLFDHGYLTITKDYKIDVSKRIKEEFENGREYYKLHGNSLQVLPSDRREYPSLEFINWHNQNIYVP